MNSRAVLWHIISILQQATLLSEITEEMMEKACTKLREDPWRGELMSEVFLILPFFLPSRCLFFDSEFDNVGEAAQIVHVYAQATCGEWADPQAHSTLLPERPDGHWEALDFVCQGTSYHWEFHTATAEHRGRGWEWGAQFALQLDEVLKKHLTGAFFEPWLGDQSGYACYLPREVASDFTLLLENLETHFGWDGYAAFVQAL